MMNTHPTCSAEADSAIDKLLIRAEPVSIVDGLFELADDGARDLSDGWDRAVYNRLQARLAERMKRTIAARDEG